MIHFDCPEVHLFTCEECGEDFYAEHASFFCEACEDRIDEEFKATLEAQGEPDMPGEDMDGDHESGLASAGLGTDEDYGYFGGDDFE